MKKSYPPFWQDGINDIQTENLESIFVEPFDNKSKRAYLCNRFRAFLQLLSDFEINMEVWINGSFCTKKVEPDDIDLVVFTSNHFVQQLSESKKSELATLFDNRIDAKLRYGCDIYIADADSVVARNYWQKQFSLDYHFEPKGIARLWVNGHD